MVNRPVALISGSRKGIGKYLTEYYLDKRYQVIGCSRKPTQISDPNYLHFCLDVADETGVKKMFAHIRKEYRSLELLINNAGVASMNHFLLTPIKSVNTIFNTNFVGTFLMCREAAKIMQRRKYGRIVNFVSVATQFKLEGEAAYSAAKAAVLSLTQILAKELADFGVTVNAIGPTPIKTDLIRSVPQETIERLINRQAIRRYGKFRDISNVIDFFALPQSDFITGQVIYLGGV